MSKYVIDRATLTAIGDAIREKLGNSLRVKVSEMPAAIRMIETGSSIEFPTLIFTGSKRQLFYGSSASIANSWQDIFTNYGDKVKLNSITDLRQGFAVVGNVASFTDLSNLTISFIDSYNSGADIYALFSLNYYLEKLPKVSGSISKLSSIFNKCQNLTSNEVNKFFENLTFVGPTSSSPTSSNFITRFDEMFYYCHKLRDINPTLRKIHEMVNSDTAGNVIYNYYDGMFSSCYMLDSIECVPISASSGIPLTHTYGFSDTFENCCRVKDIIFATQADGTPYTVKWRNQRINLRWVGSGYTKSLTPYGALAEKEVTDDATYQALKNDADWWTKDDAYSRYNHDSAVRTINSLPDTSAYLATGSGSAYTNLIGFTDTTGANTDGGAVGTLTEAEIAVAAAKGWTVTYQYPD